MKNKTTILSFLFYCFIATGLLTACGDKQAADSETVTTTTPEENPLTEGNNYNEPPDANKADTSSIEANGFVFIESSGAGVGGASYAVKQGGRTISQGKTTDGGKFNCGFQTGKTYDVTVSAEGYKPQTKTITYKGEAVKVGLAQ